VKEMRSAFGHGHGPVVQGAGLLTGCAEGVPPRLHGRRRRRRVARQQVQQVLPWGFLGLRRRDRRRGVALRTAHTSSSL
jgi:hypothetical protein